VHAAGADLDFYPFTLRPHNRDMKGFIARGFGLTEPVPQPIEIGTIKLGYNRIDAPTFGLFGFWGRINDDADRENIIHFLKGDALTLHFLVDGANSFDAPFYFVGDAKFFFELFLNGCDESADIGGTFFCGFLEFLFDSFVGEGVSVD
jgi:hypothetical protein